jgi:hypothetical protein
MNRKWILLLVALVLVTAASCAAPEPKADFSSEQVCKNLVLFNTSVDKLRQASSYADRTALQAQFQVVRTNFNNLVQSASNLDVAEKEDFQKAVDDLMSAASELPEDIPVTEALQALEDPLKQVGEAANNLKTGLECQ